MGLERHAPGAHVRFGGSVVDVVSGGVVVDGARRALLDDGLALRCGPFDVVVSDAARAAAVSDDAVDVGWWKSASMALILVLGTVVGLRLTPKIPDVGDDDLTRGKMIVARVALPPAPPPPKATPQKATPKKQPTALAQKAPTKKPLTMKQQRDDDHQMALSALQAMGIGDHSATSSVFAKSDQFAAALAGLHAAGTASNDGASGLGTRGTGGGGDIVGINGTLGDPNRRGPGDPRDGIALTGRDKHTVVVDNKRFVTEGSLDRAEIQRVMARAMSQFRYCYEKQLGTDPNLEGKLTSFFTIGGSGDVVSATALQSTLDSPNVDSCVLRILQRLKFPQPRGGGTVQVTYPFVFSVH